MAYRDSRRRDEVIVSTANPLIKSIRSLQRRRSRYLERAFVVEGFRAVEEALAANANIRTVLVRQDIAASQIAPGLRETSLRTVSEQVFREVSDVDVPQGILAVVGMPDDPGIESLRRSDALVLIADGVRDPGNLGTLLRSAAGAGADAVVIAEGSVDPYNPKVVRAAMGAHFQIPILQRDGERLDQLVQTLATVVVADASGDRIYDEIDLTGATAIVVGGEAFGPLGQLSHPNLASVRIPLARDVESLNAGVAGSLLLFEAARQRRHLV